SPTSRSLEFFSSAAAVQVLLLALCLSNTPQVTARASTLIPPLGYLLAKNDPMTEYGLRHHDDEAGVFFSRFSKTELAQNDLLRSDEAPAIFARYKNRPYNEFLAAYTPYTDPFLHEMRVRIFRRDAHWRKALAQHGAPASMRPHCTIAFYENLILEKYFGQSLRKSMHVLPAKKAAVLESCAVRPTHYKSPVSANLIVHFNPFLVWITAVVLLALFAYLRKSVLRHLAERDG
ncbi:MAG TPA: hypothetical protein PLP17_14240, partial [Oligoflexia bacterium]|nr:hypothetical protein [Oligoflexia bacterium]